MLVVAAFPPRGARRARPGVDVRRRCGTGVRVHNLCGGTTGCRSRPPFLGVPRCCCSQRPPCCPLVLPPLRRAQAILALLKDEPRLAAEREAHTKRRGAYTGFSSYDVMAQGGPQGADGGWHVAPQVGDGGCRGSRRRCRRACWQGVCLRWR